MCLCSKNLYKLGRGTNPISQKSSEESVTNMIPILKLKVEEETFSVSWSSNMASKTHASASIPKTHSMVFNVRLIFAKINIHNAQLYKDPMNRWVVKIEEHPIAFDHLNGSIFKVIFTWGKRVFATPSDIGP